MTHFNTNPFVFTVLQNVTTERLQKAVNTLVDVSAAVTLTRQTESEIRALVKNGTGKEYGVTLTEADTSCSCPDALYRGVTCKHATAVALFVLRMPQEEPQEAERKPDLKLAKVRQGYC